MLLFIALGIAFNYQNIIPFNFQNYIISEYICSFCLIFIMFYGGFGTRWEEAKGVCKESILLSTVGVILTSLITTVFCKLILNIEIKEAFLIGAVVSSTDAASVFSIIRSKRLSLRYKTSSLLELESGSNDPFSYMLTIIAIQLLNKTATFSTLVMDIILQILVGLALGYVFSKIAKFVLLKYKFKDGLDNVFIFSLAILTYAVVGLLKGNGYLAVYIVGIFLGNTNINNKVALVHFFDGVTFLMQIVLFFLLGLLSTPNLIIENIGTSFIVFLIITIVARPLSVESLLSLFKSKRKQKYLISFSGLRGAASIVFAILAHNNIKNTDIDIYHIIFGVVLFSILIQGGLLPTLAKKIDMTDPLEDPLKSFSDYQRERPIEFITFYVNEGHKWANRKIKDISMHHDLLLVLIIRQGKRIIPNGNTKIKVNDKLISIARSFMDSSQINIKEITIEKDSQYDNMRLMDLKDFEKLVILIKRGNKYIIPQGNVKLISQDELLYIDEDVL